MKNLICKCGCNIDSMCVKIKGNHKGLYCSECGKWQKRLSKNEYNKAIILGLEIRKEKEL